MGVRNALFVMIGACHLKAEFAFDLRETISGHPSMVLKTTESTSHVFVSGGKIAKLQNQIVQIVDHENSLLTLIDYHDKTFATANLAAAQRDRDVLFDKQFPQDIRSDLVSAGLPAEYEGRKVTRDIFRININSEPGPGEWLYTVDSSTAPPPDFEPLARSAELTEAHYDQELDAEIQTLAFIHIDRFKDILKARRAQNQRPALLIHSVAEFRLKKGAPLLETIGQELVDQTLIVMEMEVVDFNFSAIDFSIFWFLQGSRRSISMN